MKVTHCGVVYDCATAVKCEVNKYIKLYDENGVEIASFDHISDFSDYTVSDGEFTAPGSCSLPIPLFVFEKGGKKYVATAVNGEGMEEIALAANVLPLTGGTLSGNLDIQKASNPLVNLIGETIGHKGVMEIGSTGILWLDNLILESGSGASVFINPLETTAIHDLLGLVVRKSNGTTSHRIFGEHNKPLGSYIGNGNGSTRRINVGSFKSPIFINSVHGMVIGCTMGVLIARSSGVTFHSDKGFMWDDGILELTSTDSALNGNGVTYSYYSL